MPELKLNGCKHESFCTYRAINQYRDRLERNVIFNFDIDHFPGLSNCWILLSEELEKPDPGYSVMAALVRCMNIACPLYKTRLLELRE